jgi:hypothetical protein
MRASRPSFVFIPLLLVLIGCTNEPGVLELKLVPEHLELAPNEPIRITAKLTARHRPVCISRGHVFQIEMTPLGETEQRCYRNFNFACGTPFAESLPFYPFFLAMGLFDVADISRRYELVTPRQPLTHDLLGTLHGDVLRIALDTKKAAPSQVDVSPWPVGRYRLHIQLINRGDWRRAISSYPAPLFWRPYDCPVAAEVTVEVTASTESPR